MDIIFLNMNKLLAKMNQLFYSNGFSPMYQEYLVKKIGKDLVSLELDENIIFPTFTYNHMDGLVINHIKTTQECLEFKFRFHHLNLNYLNQLYPDVNFSKLASESKTIYTIWINPNPITHKIINHKTIETEKSKKIDENMDNEPINSNESYCTSLKGWTYKLNEKTGKSYILTPPTDIPKETFQCIHNKKIFKIHWHKQDKVFLCHIIYFKNMTNIGCQQA